MVKKMRSMLVVTKMVMVVMVIVVVAGGRRGCGRLPQSETVTVCR